MGQKNGRVKVRKLEVEIKAVLRCEELEEERKKTTDGKAAMLHLSQVNQCPASSQAIDGKPETPIFSLFIAEHDSIWHRIYFG